MQVKLYNTLTKTKEEFKPIDNKEVKIYTCGPTVYSYAHIGNFRTYIFMDNIRRVLKYNGYDLKHVMNITDVGHLESDADEGEDKMEKAARKENKNPYEIAKYYESMFFRDIERLNIEKPETIARATEHIPEMIEYVQKLIDNGYAYETSRGIYFDISKLDKYPILSNINLEEQKVGVRIEADPEKRNPYDFALWIKAPENHLMKWDSPWGPSYPGWHIECSAMGKKYLGEQFDIHTGGIDLIPTHHENEIAQSKGACGKIPARYWIHGEYLLINGGKMSKSLGNVYLVKDFIEKGYDPIAYKLFSYSCHYRNKLNFTWEGLEAASKSLERLRNSYQLNLNGTDKLTIEDKEKLKQIEEGFHKAINDDLNMPLAMSFVWEAAKFEKKNPEIAEILTKFDNILGIKINEENSGKQDIPKEILDLVDKRRIARENKEWNKSDELRDLINQKGYDIKDTKQGTEIKKR